MSVSKLKGETWTKRTARSGFPILVEYVRNRWEITYGEWDAEIVRRGLGHHVMAAQYGYPAGAIGDACQQYADQTGAPQRRRLTLWWSTNHLGCPTAGRMPSIQNQTGGREQCRKQRNLVA